MNEAYYNKFFFLFCVTFVVLKLTIFFTKNEFLHKKFDIIVKNHRINLKKKKHFKA